jgi:hypothetical protein
VGIRGVVHRRLHQRRPQDLIEGLVGAFRLCSCGSGRR